MGAIERRHDPNVRAITVTPEGQIAVAGIGLRIFAADGQTLIRELPISARRIIYSPDGQLIAAAQGPASLYRASDGAHLHQFIDDPDRHVKRMAWSADSRLLATLEPPTLRDPLRFVFWDVTTGRQVPAPVTLPSDTNDLAFTPDGTRVVVSTRTGLIVIRMSDGQALARAAVPLGQLTLTSDNTLALLDTAETLLAIRIADGTIAWEVLHGATPVTPRARRAPYGGAFSQLVLSPDQQYLLGSLVSGPSIVSSNRAAWMLLIRVRDGAVVRTYRDHRGGITALSFSPDSQTFLSATNDAELARWKVAPLAPWLTWLPLLGVLVLLGHGLWQL